MTDSDKNCPYCGTHIDDHPASPCLNAWVAEDVMEWWNVSEGDGWFGFHFVKIEGAAMPVYDPVPHFSDSIIAAWQVVEMLRQNYYVDIGVDDNGAQVQLDCLHVNNLGNTRWQLAFVGSTRANTAPLAICRTAIKLEVIP